MHPFLTRLIHYCLKKICLYVLLKRICLILNQMIFSGLILGLAFCHVNLLFVQHLFHRMLIFLLSLLLLDVTRKTSVIILYVTILSVRVAVMLIELINMYILFLVHLIVLKISVSLLRSLPVIHILLISVHLRSVLLVIVSCAKV